MEINSHHEPLLIAGQYVTAIGDHKLYYNPLGYGGVTVVDPRSQRLLDLCNGKLTVEQVCERDGRAASEVREEIRTLATREVLWISERFTKELHQGINAKSSISCWMLPRLPGLIRVSATSERRVTVVPKPTPR